ncbi:glycosyltransferase family 2 protein [Myroides odoratimimus]|uniref:glycosyltransferase family 2 protein n=1 Tax=Myroides odoratimimus TaxID=76832 RepID=UPI002575DF4B|nr:glycosyltransferase family 2 protein [Myroides odoratimimus]MDM1086235.1 glycosyltransferase family 2 protein [Myroides odoratimimus]
MENKKVSIITPVYNGELFLPFTAQSIFAQSYNDWEWIIVDDCSTDSSWKLIEEYVKTDSRIIGFKNDTNLRAGLSRNKAIEFATGRFIAFLDSDDIWRDDKLEKQVNFMLSSNYAFSFTAYDYIDENNSSIRKPNLVDEEVDYKSLLKNNQIGCLTAMYDIDKLGKVYMSSHARKQDYGLWLFILKNKTKYAYGLNEVLASYRISKNQATAKKHKLIFKHFSFLKDTQKFGNFRALYYTASWMITGFYKHFMK